MRAIRTVGCRNAHLQNLLLPWCKEASGAPYCLTSFNNIGEILTKIPLNASTRIARVKLKKLLYFSKKKFHFSRIVLYEGPCLYPILLFHDACLG